MFKYRISGVRKKKIEGKVRREDFWVEILLSSCSLVRLYVCFFCKLKLRKKNGNFQSVFRSGLKLKVVGRF